MDLLRIGCEKMPPSTSVIFRGDYQSNGSVNFDQAVENVSEQAGNRWRRRDVSEQAGNRWRRRDVTEQTGNRWRRRDVSEQTGNRWRRR